VNPASAAVLAVLATLAYAALHSLLASLGAKARARQWLGPVSDRIYRFGYNVIGAVTLLPVLAIPALEPGPVVYRIPSPLSWLFLSAQAASALLIVIGILHTDPWHFLGLRQIVEPAQGAESKLVTTGLYRYVRHPLYTAGLLFLWLTPIMTTTLLALYLSLSLYLYVGSFFEERRLRVEFGEAYADYQRRVPRLVPRRPA
jgi:protein-S-isoprenylcysteine O-methyltransferase Ste14